MRTVVAGILLAAGGGTRFRGSTHKLLAPYRGRPLVSWALDAAIESGLSMTVVTGAVDISALVPSTVMIVHNRQWSDGQASSLRAALEVVARDGHEAVVVGLGDQPGIPPETWRALAEAEGDLVVPTYDGVRGNPVRLGAAVWHLLPSRGDAVGRTVMRSQPALVRELPCAGHPFDIDTVEDLNKWS